MKHNYLTMKLILIVCIAFSSLNAVFAQNRTVSGKVTSAEDDSAIPGVNIVVKGTATGTVTDVEGNYNISVPDDATLVFSAIGFTTQEISVDNQSTINLSLDPDIQALSEVVVMGYGSQRKADITSAVSVIDVEKVKDRPNHH